MSVLTLEDRMDMLLRNHYDLELSALEYGLQRNIFPGKMSSMFDDMSTIINTRVSNVLTTTRMYVEHTETVLKRTYGRRSYLNNCYDEMKSQAWDASFGYRLCDALRDHTHHMMAPVKKMSMPSERVSDEEESLHHVRRAIPHLDIEGLRENPAFRQDPWKKQVRSQIEERFGITNQQAPDLLPYIRGYIAQLGYIHECLRDRMKDDLEQAKSAYCAPKERFEKQYQDVPMGLVVMKRNERGECDEFVSLTSRIIDRIDHLCSKNFGISKIESRYVSSL